MESNRGGSGDWSFPSDFTKKINNKSSTSKCSKNKKNKSATEKAAQAGGNAWRLTENSNIKKVGWDVKLMMCSIVGPLNSHLWFMAIFKVDARHHSRKLLPASQSLEENAKKLKEKGWYSKHRSKNFSHPAVFVLFCFCFCFFKAQVCVPPSQTPWNKSKTAVTRLMWFV